MADGAGGELAVGEGVTFSEALGQEICARVAAGETLTSVCESPGMPHRMTVNVWARKDPQFGGAMARARLAARTSRRLLEREATAVWMARPKRRSGRKPMYTRELGEAICERLSNGESLLAISRDPRMPTAPTVFRWLREHPDFQDMYVIAREAQAHYLFDEAREVALGATPKSVWADRLRFDTIRWMTARLAPKKYCERIVADVEAAARRAEAARAGGDGGLTVVIRRFTDAPDPEAGAFPEID